MTIVVARAAFPTWVLAVGFGAFMVPAAIATATLVVALGLVCIPAVAIAVVGGRRPATQEIP